MTASKRARWPQIGRNLRRSRRAVSGSPGMESEPLRGLDPGSDFGFGRTRDREVAAMRGDRRWRRSHRPRRGQWSGLESHGSSPSHLGMDRSGPNPGERSDRLDGGFGKARGPAHPWTGSSPAAAAPSLTASIREPCLFGERNGGRTGYQGGPASHPNTTPSAAARPRSDPGPASLSWTTHGVYPMPRG